MLLSKFLCFHEVPGLGFEIRGLDWKNLGSARLGFEALRLSFEVLGLSFEVLGLGFTGNMCYYMLCSFLSNFKYFCCIFMSKRTASSKNTRAFEGLMQKTCSLGDSQVAERAQGGHQGSSGDHSTRNTAGFEGRMQKTL